MPILVAPGQVIAVLNPVIIIAHGGHADPAINERVGQMLVAAFIFSGDELRVDHTVLVPFAEILQGFLHFGLECADDQLSVLLAKIELIGKDHLPESAEHDIHPLQG
ncbi:hypothetical protein D3C75_1089570 [compost metagenome]